MRRRSKSGVIVAVAVIASLCALLRIIPLGGATVGTGGVLTRFVSSGDTATQLLRFELSSDDLGSALVAAFFTPGIPYTEQDAADEDKSELYKPLPATTHEPTPVPTAEPAAEPNELFYNREDIEPVAPEGIDNFAPLPSSGIQMQNTSGLDIDIGALLSEPLELDIAQNGEPTVLIIHTHGSEAYTQVEGEEYEESDPYRTQDKSKSIIYVGDVLAEELAARGISVVHDRETYDYPSYAGSYNRTLEAIESYLEKYPSISLVIDLHRDAQESKDGSQYKTIAEIGDTRCAQIMLVVGTNGSGLTHPNWQKNMKLALRLEYEMNRSYPTLARPVGVRQYRYNQHMTDGSLIVEVGAAGNTFTEAVTAVKYFAQAYADVILADSGASDEAPAQ